MAGAAGGYEADTTVGRLMKRSSRVTRLESTVQNKRQISLSYGIHLNSVSGADLQRQ